MIKKEESAYSNSYENKNKLLIKLNQNKKNMSSSEKLMSLPNLHEVCQCYYSNLMQWTVFFLNWSLFIELSPFLRNLLNNSWSCKLCDLNWSAVVHFFY